MPKKRLFQLGLAFSISLIVGCVFYAIPASGRARQTAPRNLQVTLLPDYANNQVIATGMISSPVAMHIDEARLSHWGFEGDWSVWSADAEETSQNFYFQGVLSNANLQTPEESGPYKLVLGPLQLPPGDTLAVAVPFTSLVWDDISPAPQNLDEARDTQIPLAYLHYTADAEPFDLTLEIPFVPIKREIQLNFFPLVGELLQKEPDSFRLYGQVSFKGIQDYGEFEKYCQWTVEDPFWSYRLADTLFALDYLPVFHFGYLPPTFQYKPSYLLARSDLQSCAYKEGTGEVLTSITGRVFVQPRNTARFPQFLVDSDVPERQTELQRRGHGTGVYEIQLGAIALGPGDLLKIALPNADVRVVSPAPARYSYTDAGDTLVEYDGPRKFTLNVRYSPRPTLFVQQIPAIIRALGSRIENTFSGLNAGLGNWQPWTVLVLCLAVILGAQHFGQQLKWWQRASIWLIAAGLCYYSFPHVFGLILFAIGVHLVTTWKSGSRDTNIRNILALLTALVFLVLDMNAHRLVFMQGAFQLDLTLFTPTLLLLFGFIVVLIYRKPKQKLTWEKQKVIAPALILFAFSVLDALQKSLPALLFVGGVVFYIVQRYTQLPPQDKAETDHVPDLPGRFKAVWKSQFWWIGLLVFTIFVVANNVATTTEVLAPELGVVRFLLTPILLVCSVVLSFLATGGLFLVLYPALPFKEGYLKAIAFSVGLWLVFLLGVGSDNRLIVALPVMLIGRFIYYLSAPLLIGIFMESYIGREAAKAQAEADKAAGEESVKKETSDTPTFASVFDQLKKRFGPWGSLISLVAPAAFALISHHPLVTSYFNVLQALIQFTLG